QFRKSSHNAKNQPNDIEPSGMQPVIEARANEPTNHRCGWENYGQLCVRGHLPPRIPALRRLRRHTQPPKEGTNPCRSKTLAGILLYGYGQACGCEQAHIGYREQGATALAKAGAE